MRLLFIANTRLGDAILSTGLLSYYSQSSGDIEITVICSPLTKPIFESVPNVICVMAYQKQKRAGHWFKAWSEIERGPWDIIVDLRNSLFSKFLRAKKVIRYKTNKKVMHRVVSLGRLVGKEDNPPAPKVFINTKDEEKTKEFFANLDLSKKLIAVAPSTNWRRKNWPIEKFAKLLKKLTSENDIFPKAYILVFGGPNEEKDGMKFRKLLKSSQVILLVYKISIMEIGAIMKRCSLFIGNDSGLMHLAASLGVTTLGLFGPSQDIIYSPWGKKCSFVRTPESYSELIFTPGYDTNDPNSLMTNLTVEKVYEACVRTLKL